MKIFVSIFAFILVLGLIVWGMVHFNSHPNKAIAGYSTDDSNAPHAQIDEKKFNFGHISVTQTVNHDFLIINSGNNPLTISDIMTSCHCTTAILKVAGQADSPEFNMNHSNWSEDIPVGAGATLTVKYDPNVMPVSGEVSRVVTFSTNDPQNKQIQLEITANVN